MAKKKENNPQIVLYRTEDGQARVEVNLQKETVWLDTHQMAQLFGRDRTVILRHLSNVYKTNELDKKTTCAKFAQVAADGKTRIMDIYNLDAILSVGYRVNSKRGTQFRIWATSILKKHLLDGYTLNQKRLEAQNEKIRGLQKAIDLISRVAGRKVLSTNEADGLIRIIRDYSYGLDLIDAYDMQRVTISGTQKRKAFPIDYKAARKTIECLRNQYQASDLFGREKDNSFKGSLVSIFQTFDGKELYPSIEEKAAHLLYFLVKNHPFADGNKRIAAFMFLWFLDKNNYLYRNDNKRIADNTLVALTLMTAESDAKEKDIIVKVIVNLINEKN
jgi:prophage maintenance system killer protein